MDGKKTNLTPELKEIYDRVMNTSGGAPATPPSSQSQGVPPVTPTAINPMDPPPVDPMATNHSIPTANQNPMNPMNVVQAPAMPMTPGAPPVLPSDSTPTNGTPIMPTFAAPGLTLSPPTMDPTPAEQALTSTPARPVTEGNTFAFGGGHATPAPAPAQTANGALTPAKKKAKISMPIIIVLGVAFVAVWGVFWAIIFGFIQR